MKRIKKFLVKRQLCRAKADLIKAIHCVNNYRPAPLWTAIFLKSLHNKVQDIKAEFETI